MQRLALYLFSLALTFGGFAARAAGDTKAAELLAQARDALGGDAKLSKVQGLSASGTFQREMGDRQVTGEITIDLQLPDKMVRTDSMSPMGDATIVVLQGVNGDQLLRNSRTIGGGPGMIVRMAPPGGGGPDADAQALRNQRAEMARLALSLLLTSPPSTPAEFSYGGEAEATDNDKADIIDAKGQGSFAARIFLDRNNHRPLMLQYRGAAPRIVMQTRRGDAPPPDAAAAPGRGDHDAPAGGLPAPQIVDIQMFLDDYKPVDGVLLPHHISRSIDGKPTEEWTFKTIKVNPAFKPDAFSGK
jgi:hypothetical protein